MRGTKEQPSVPLGLDQRISGLTVLLVLADVIAVLVAGLTWHLPFLAVLGLGGVLIICRANARVYRRRLRLSYFDEFPRSVASVAAGFGLSVAIFLLVTGTGPKDKNALTVTLIFVALSELQRIVVFAVVNICRRRFGRGDRTVVVGMDAVGVDLAQHMLDYPEFGLRPVGIIELGSIELGDRPIPVPLLEGDLASNIINLHVGTVVLAAPAVNPAQLREAAIAADRAGCSILMLPRLPELYRDSPEVERLHGYPLVRVTSDPTRRISWWIKRALDRAMGVLTLALLAPIIGICALAVHLESGGPIFFAQQRVGVDGRPFTLYKFRSMRPHDEHESQTQWSVAGDNRIGPVGRTLRRTSLDELPQLWNIIRGEMSIVGPRPERPGFVAEFSAKHDGYGARHRVPTGLTGLAQVTGLRGNTSISDRVRFDNYYIANWSLWLDFKIVLRTLRECLRRGDH
jgi:exopolysaccharide biosynthesis polyprenyl glycosylphosphotransferase